jgi:hypothetical protein
MSDPGIDPVTGAPAAPTSVAPAAPRRRRTPRSASKAVQIAWPLATIGALSVLAGNPLAPPGAPPAPPSVASGAQTSPASYVAPDGRSFAQLVAMHVLPDPQQTPGVLNADVTPGTISSTICVHGWTAKVRPPTSYTDAIKDQSVPSGHTKAEYELDHLDSIEDGGDPKDRNNLWMQAYNDTYGARTKDVLETKVAHMVCAGTLTLDQARAALAPNWLVGFQQYVGPLPTGE